MKRQTKIIIALSIILLIFVIIISIIIFNKLKPIEEEPNDDFSSDIWAENIVDPDWDATEEEISEEDKVSLTIGDSIYEDLEKMTKEQYADRENYVRLIKNYCSTSIKTIEIIDSNEELIFVKATYSNDESEELVVTYDPYVTHGFMRCVSREYYEYIESGANAG